MFALPYPKQEETIEKELQESLNTERKKYQDMPIDVWFSNPDDITLDDALKIIGLTEVPSLKVLEKLHVAMTDDYKDEFFKKRFIAKAFEILGVEAVKIEMS